MIIYCWNFQVAIGWTNQGSGKKGDGHQLSNICCHLTIIFERLTQPKLLRFPPYAPCVMEPASMDMYLRVNFLQRIPGGWLRIRHRICRFKMWKFGTNRFKYVQLCIYPDFLRSLNSVLLAKYVSLSLKYLYITD